MRLYQNFLGGRLNVQLSDVGATLSSPALAGMREVVSGDEMLLTLDPDGLNGLPEVVRVTLHPPGDATATIERNVQGSVGRIHRAGTYWIHGPLVSDLGVWLVSPNGHRWEASIDDLGVVTWTDTDA